MHCNTPFPSRAGVAVGLRQAAWRGADAVVGLHMSRGSCGGAVSGRNKLAAIHASIVGGDCTFQTPFGPKRLLYADWAASGRAVAPLEDFLRSEVSKACNTTHVTA